jgi:glycosyltransferase involved in cell wall biosynthesis
MRKKRFSIIMPTLNSEKFVCSALKSLLNQNFTDFELIVVDGGSVDNTLPLVKMFFQEAHIIKQVGTGIWDAINLGIVKSEGEIIHILNSDDLISSSTLQEVDVVFSENNLIEALWIPTYSAAGYLYKVSEREIYKGMHKYAPGHSASFFVYKGIHDKFGLYDVSIKYCADHHFYWKLLFNNVKSKCINSRKTYGVFTFGGFSSTNKYFDKVSEEYLFRKESTRLSDLMFCNIIAPLKWIWSNVKHR